jgi:hypothetical protein
MSTAKAFLEIGLSLICSHLPTPLFTPYSFLQVWRPQILQRQPDPVRPQLPEALRHQIPPVLPQRPQLCPRGRLPP